MQSRHRKNANAKQTTPWCNIYHKFDGALETHELTCHKLKEE